MEWDQNFSANGGKEFDVDENAIGPGYFEAMRIPFLDGRDFRWDDTSAGGKRVILNRTAASLLLPGRNPLGQIVMKNDDGKRVAFQVIGVVGDTKYDDMRSPAPPIAYQAITQNDSEHAQSYTAVVRMDGPPAPLAGAARAILHQLNPDIPVPTMTSMSSVIDNRLSAERTMALLSVFFALCALIVTAIGLYGTLAYATARRTSEIGIRMALGARRSQVARMVFLQNSAVAFAGTCSGLLAALLASRFLASFLYRTSTRDPWVFAGSIAALAMIATAASLLPAIRAARIEPMEAIRCE